MREMVSYIFIIECIVIESKVSELNYLLGLAFRTADWTLWGHLQCLDNARPTKYMPTLRRTPFLHIVITNATKRLLCLLFVDFTDLSFLLAGGLGWMRAAFCCVFINCIQAFDGFDNRSKQKQVALKGVAHISDLIILIGVDILNAQQSLNESEMLIPVQHIHHQDKPLHVAHYLLWTLYIPADPLLYSRHQPTHFLQQILRTSFFISRFLCFFKSTASLTEDFENHRKDKVP